MTYEQALKYIHATDWRGSRPGLSRISELLAGLGNPEDKLKYVHVGGTNGKGSFCSMLSSVLCEAGLKVGLFTSPYIEYFEERIMINGTPIDRDALARFTEEASRIADKMADPPTEFELITAIGLLYFAHEKCDIVVLEVGLGGRLDATNIIKTPVLDVITGIALDHTAILGNTVTEIALEKAGIIKSGTPVLIGSATAENDRADVDSVIREKAAECGSRVYSTDLSALSVSNSSIDGSTLDYKSHRNIKIPLLSLYQPKNAANVLEAVDMLRELGYEISEDAVIRGMKKTKWKARFEKLCDEPLIFFDGSHNPQGVAETVRSIKHYFGKEKLVLLTGVMADKDYTDMAKMLSDVVCETFTLTPANPRSLTSDELAELYRNIGVRAHAYKTAKEAVKAATDAARAQGKPVLCAGSLYMYSEIKEALKSIVE